MNPIDLFEQDLRQDLHNATTSAAPSLPEVDVTDVIVRGSKAVRRRRVGTSLGAVAAAVVIGVTVWSGGVPRADIRPATPSGVVVTRTGTADLPADPDPAFGSNRQQHYAVSFTLGQRGSEQVLDVVLRGDDGQTHRLTYTATQIARGDAVVWLNTHEAAAIAPTAARATLVSSAPTSEWTTAVTLIGTDDDLLIHHFRQPAPPSTPVGLVWQNHSDDVVGSPQVEVKSLRVGVLGRTTQFWVSERLNRAGMYFPLGALDVPWRVPGHLPALRDDDTVSHRTILLVQVPSATVTLATDPADPAAPQGVHPIQVSQTGTSWWAVFDTAMLPKTSRVTWTMPDGTTGSGTVQATSALG
jgi:hypothetical protein